jgi:predicted nicotinamide N-methyase
MSKASADSLLAPKRLIKLGKSAPFSAYLWNGKKVAAGRIWQARLLYWLEKMAGTARQSWP